MRPLHLIALLLCLLAERERTVTELENILSLRQPMVSQQLARLRLDSLNWRLMVVRALSGGGAQRDAIELANGLRAAGWPMQVATLDAAGPRAQFSLANRAVHNRTAIHPCRVAPDIGTGGAHAAGH